MGLEIKELYIKVTVNQPSQGQQPAAAPAGGNNKPEEEKEAIIAQSIEAFIEISKNKNER
ncbi:hypothetical protein FAM09_00320 [Niastella caeni]|uniref:Uncharacterized protein n=1 Tax=Niastella caeni TaxID=2569763 RepID=A0A4S8I218_9BACT|nr:DUF5908 family protein [Niastella caeni]THU40594.1 hypothetical protein FAM09_00320 [Niastella caeni]